MPSVRASCCLLPLATPSGECVNHQSSVTLLCLQLQTGFVRYNKTICHASVGNMMECLPSGGWFSLGLRPRGKPSSLGSFRHVTHTGMAYLYNMYTLVIMIYTPVRCNLAMPRVNLSGVDEHCRPSCKVASGNHIW